MVSKDYIRHFFWTSPLENESRGLSLWNWVWCYYHWSNKGWSGTVVRVLGFQWDRQRRSKTVGTRASIKFEWTGA